MDSDEYKGKEYKTGICSISDYNDLVEGDGVNWAWVDPSVRVGGAGSIDVSPIKNKSDVTDATLGTTTQENFKQAFERIGKTVGPGGLKSDACIYWVERFSPGKAFVPFAGGHLMQAGLGIEVTITDRSGKAVAKIRHDGRAGASPSEASGQVVDDIVNFIAKH